MARIQLDQEVLDVEKLIDDRGHDEAFRRLILLRDRFGRRPEYRYLKALFDVTFEVRSDNELLADVRALVAEQPDFLEAVSLLAFLLDRTGDHDRATVFAREAVQALNDRARARAEKVLGDAPSNPTADEVPFSRRSSGSLKAVRDSTEVVNSEPKKAKPIVMPTPGAMRASGQGTNLRTRATREMFSADSDAFPAAPPLLEPLGSPAPFPPEAMGAWSDPQRMPSEPAPFRAEPGSGDTLDGLPTATTDPPMGAQPKRLPSMPPAPEPMGGPGLRRPSTIPPMAMPSEPPGVVAPEEGPSGEPMGDRVDSQPPTKGPHELMAETIPFVSADVPMPPPPTIPPGALDTNASASPNRSSGPFADRVPTAPAFGAVHAGRVEARGRDSKSTLREGSFPKNAVQRAERATDAPPPRRSEPSRERPAGVGITPPVGVSGTPTSLSPDAVDRSGVERKRTNSGALRPAVALPDPTKQLHTWFQFARENQLLPPPDGGFSTARTLLDLAERVVEGSTPLAPHPIPLDRRGLLQVEQRLQPIRGRAGAQPVTERGAVTAAASFLLGLLLKECDGRASDTSAEDGACKVVIPSGATVRPLLVAAAFARARGPGLVETFDRAATAHMRRGPTRISASRTVSQPAMEAQHPRRVSDHDLTVLRRDLDASTLGVVHPDTPPAPNPPMDLRLVATDFWLSALGREIIGSSHRVGMFTIADVDALERYACKIQRAVGFAPPGAPWPWSPSKEYDDLVVCWGAVLGEVLVGLYSGRWEADPGNPDDTHLFRVVLSGGVVAWPIAEVYLRLARGIAHDISVYVDAVGRVVGRQAVDRQP